MSKLTNKPHPQFTRRKKLLWRMAMAICGAHGLHASIRKEAAAEITANAYRIPPEKLQAYAHQVASRALAADLHIPRRDVPLSRIASKAIAEYEYERRRRDVRRMITDGVDNWVSGFDYQSRRFAIENGVCPRCGELGAFTEDGGACQCGFKF